MAITDHKGPDNRDVQATGSTTAAETVTRHESSYKDHFLKLMFFQASHATGGVHPRPPADRVISYAPLKHTHAQANRYALPVLTTAVPVQLDSPATEVMTDLRRVPAVTIDRLAPIEEGNRAMIVHRVRALFVVDETRQVLGIITATDIVGERPVQFAQERGVRHDEILVRDIMTPADRLEVLDIQDVQGARVGDMVATLKLAGRQHALAVEAMEGDQHTVRGIFSLTQIARQLGIPLQQPHDVARTFAEIEAAIAS